MKMQWKDETYCKITDIIDKALSLEGAEQREFVKEFCALGPYARQNVGYFSGYYNEEKARKIMEVFETSHPIFGSHRPSAQEAYEMGKSLGKTAKS